MLFRLCHEVQIGDYVVFTSKSDRMMNNGIVTGEYRCVPDATEYVQQRSVKWLKHLQRMSFSQVALYDVGSAMSIFTIKNYSDEFLSVLAKYFHKNKIDDGADENVAATADGIIENTKYFILKELSHYPKGYAL